MHRVQIGGLTIGLYEVDGQYPEGEHTHALPAVGTVFHGACCTRFKNGQELIERPGVINIEPAGERHADHMVGEFHSSCAIEVDESSDSRFANLRHVLSEPQVIDTPASNLFLRIVSELQISDPASLFSIEGLALEMLGGLLRLNSRKHRPASPNWLGRVEELLKARFTEPPPLDQIARDVGHHPMHVVRTFRKHKGCTMGQFLRRLRAEKAAELLRRTDEPLVSIALNLGFCDQASFTRSFRSVYGTTPGAMREHRQKR